MTRHRLSPHFVIEEFDCRDGTHVPDALVTAYFHLCTYWLEPLRLEFGPVHVISGFRTVAHNKAVGGAVHSVHLGRTPLPSRPARSQTAAAAADVVCRRAGQERVRRWAQRHVVAGDGLGELGRGGIGSYPGAGFTHLDTGPRREWTV